MKKTEHLVKALALLVALGFVVVACGGEKKTTSKTQAIKTATPAKPTTQPSSPAKTQTAPSQAETARSVAVAPVEISLKDMGQKKAKKTYLEIVETGSFAGGIFHKVKDGNYLISFIARAQTPKGIATIQTFALGTIHDLSVDRQYNFHAKVNALSPADLDQIRADYGDNAIGAAQLKQIEKEMNKLAFIDIQEPELKKGSYETTLLFDISNGLFSKERVPLMLALKVNADRLRFADSNHADVKAWKAAKEKAAQEKAAKERAEKEKEQKKQPLPQQPAPGKNPQPMKPL